MNILLVCKRFVHRNDATDPNVALMLMIFRAMRHDVVAVCVDHKSRGQHDHEHGRMRVAVRSLLRPLRLWRELRRAAREADVVVGSDHPYIALFGMIAANDARKPFVYSVRDNYDAYRPQLPFQRLIDRMMLRNAARVVTISDLLGAKVLRQNAHVTTIRSSVDTGVFRPMDRARACHRINADPTMKRIVYTGAIESTRGIDVLLEAFRIVRHDNPDTRLVLVGKNTLRIAPEEGVELVGEVPPATVPFYCNSADVLVVPNTDNAFTKYCFPQKLVEYAATGKPIVATAVGDVKRVLAGRAPLAAPGDAASLANAIVRGLALRRNRLASLVRQHTVQTAARQWEQVLEAST